MLVHENETDVLVFDEMIALLMSSKSKFMLSSSEEAVAALSLSLSFETCGMDVVSPENQLRKNMLLQGRALLQERGRKLGGAHVLFEMPSNWTK